jgi:hypothetical protein
VSVSFNALTAKLNNSDNTLAESLISQNAIKEGTAIKVGIIPDKYNSGKQVRIPITLKDGEYSASPEEIRSVIPTAAHWSAASTNSAYSDNIDNHIINSAYFTYLLDNNYVYFFDDPSNPHARKLAAGKSVSINENLGIVVFDNNDHVCAYGYGRIVTQDSGKYYYNLTLCDYDISGLVASVKSEWETVYQNADRLSMSDFYTTDVTFRSAFTNENGVSQENENTRTLLKISDNKFTGDIASVAYMIVTGSSSGFSDKLSLLHEWISYRYSTFKDSRFAGNEYIHITPKDPSNMQNSGIRSYDQVFICLYDSSFTLVGWAYGSSSDIPS